MTADTPEGATRNPEGILQWHGVQVEVKSHLTQRFVYDPIQVNALYKALRDLDIKCVMEFANYDDEARAQEVFEALYDCQVFHDLFYGIGDESADYQFKEHDPEA